MATIYRHFHDFKKGCLHKLEVDKEDSVLKPDFTLHCKGLKNMETCPFSVMDSYCIVTMCKRLKHENITDCKAHAVYRKTDIKACKLHAVDSFRILLIGGTGIF